MSVYNGDRYLKESIESILNQTFTDFEFIIIDDGSSDSSWDILTEYASKDRRVRLFKNEENIGLTQSLNKGLRLAKGEYIARQDADDISLPARFEKQVSYMELHRSVALVSTGVQYIDDKNNKLATHTPPTDLVMLQWELLFRNPIRHSTVLWRRELVNSKVGDYNPNFAYSQDYDLWVRISEQLIIDTLPLVLVVMRQHSKSITLTKLNVQDALVNRVAYRKITTYFPTKRLTEQDIADLRAMPRLKYHLQYQHFANLSATRFQQAAYEYLRLWQQFCKANSVTRNALSLQALQQEVEQDLVDLLRHCKQKIWLTIGLELVLFYLRDRPNRTLALSYTLLQILAKATLISWYRSLRSIQPLKNA
jgi:glycosyltransferase involved in cell wall biosynthesis